MIPMPIATARLAGMMSSWASVIKIRPKSPYSKKITPAERIKRFGRGSIPEARSRIRRCARSSRADSIGSNPATAIGSSKASSPASVGLELEDVAVLLHRLLELAGVEPVSLAFGTAVDDQVGPQERHFPQVLIAPRASALRRQCPSVGSEASKRSSSFGFC